MQKKYFSKISNSARYWRGCCSAFSAWGTSTTEEIIIALTDFIDIDTVKSCGVQLFDEALLLLNEPLGD